MDQDQRLEPYNDLFKDNEWAYFLISRVDLSKETDLNISILLSTNIKKGPLLAVVTYLKNNFSETYPKAVEGLVFKQNDTKVKLAGLIIGFVRLTQPQLCLICDSDYFPFSDMDSTDMSPEVINCFICKMPSHTGCVDETNVSEKQGIVLLCHNCVQRKSVYVPKSPVKNDSSSQDESSDASSDNKESPPKKKDKRKSLKKKGSPSKPVSSKSEASDDESKNEQKKRKSKSLVTKKISSKSKSKSSESETSEDEQKKGKSKSLDTKKTSSKPKPETSESETSDSDDEIDSDEPNTKLKKDVICPLLIEGRCPHGITGKKCKYKHKRFCYKYCGFGDRKNHPAGCRFGEKCKFLHPKLCENSVELKVCYNKECKLCHLKFTRRNKEDYYEQKQQSYRSNYNQNYSEHEQKEKWPTENKRSTEFRSEYDWPRKDRYNNFRRQQNRGNYGRENDQHFLGVALEKIQKELSNHIQTQIQEQMQLHLQKIPQVNANWFPAPNRQIQQFQPPVNQVQQPVKPVQTPVPQPTPQNQW